MPIVILALLWLVSSLILFLFGFLTGRFARKLPVIDDNLPWTLHWGQILSHGDHLTTTCEEILGRPEWPRNPHQGNHPDAPDHTSLCSYE